MHPPRGHNVPCRPLRGRLSHHPERDAELERVAGQLRMLLPGPPLAAQWLNMICAALGNRVRMIPVAEVLYFGATDKYVNVVTADSELFWQIHLGIVVNVNCIQAAVRDETGKLSLKLRGRNERLAVSRIYAHLFRQM